MNTLNEQKILKIEQGQSKYGAVNFKNIDVKGFADTIKKLKREGISPSNYAKQVEYFLRKGIFACLNKWIHIEINS